MARGDRRGPGRGARLVGVLLVLALLGSAVAADHWRWGSRLLGWEPAPTPPAQVAAPPTLALPQAPAPTLPVTPVPVAQAGSPDEAAVRRVLRRHLRDRDLGPHVVALVGGLAGGADVALGAGAVVPASTIKLLTAAAALSTLGPDARFTTRVVTGERPRELVLVGGGDPYLSSTPAATAPLAPEGPDASPAPGTGAGTTTYPPRADLTTLANETAAALVAAGDAGPRRLRLRYDDRLFTGPAENPTWRPDYVRDQIVAPTSALAVEGGRTQDGWGRAADPARAAAEEFAAALRAAGVRVARQVRAVPQDAPDAAALGAQLATVESAPLDQVVERALAVSDNEATEILARHVALAVGGEGSVAALPPAMVQALAGVGVDASGDVIHDGSGLSRSNRVSAATLLAVLRAAASEQHPELRPVVDGLPVAGFSGSLTLRFAEGDPDGLGMVRAKTGTLTGVHALAGLVTDRDGTVMPFVLAADRVPADKSLEAREALDGAAAALAACRCGAAG